MQFLEIHLVIASLWIAENKPFKLSLSKLSLSEPYHLNESAFSYVELQVKPSFICLTCFKNVDKFS